MKGAVVDGTDVLDEVVHGGVTVEVERTELHLPGDGEHPPLAIERTVGQRAAGPPVVLVHGFAQNRYTWRVTGRSLVAWLAAQGHEVLNVELRGHGRSRALGAGNATQFADYVDDLSRVVDACDAPPVVIGHSLGGGVGVATATVRPLGGLVHLAGVYTFARGNPTLRALARLTLRLERQLLRTPLRMSTGWAGSLLARLYAVTDIAGYGAPIAGWVPESIERDLLAERLERGFDWTSVEVWLQMARWARGEPFVWSDAFQQTDVPLLVLCGDHDPLVREVDARACFEQSGSSDKEFVLFDAFHHKVHWGHVDLILGRHAPEVVWPVIASWLASRRP
jgi:pimeloyl-ACP methyl ester carboxylesterase